MKHLLLTTIAAVLVVGCGPPKPPDISIREAVKTGNIEAVKQHLAAGTDVNAKTKSGFTPLDEAMFEGEKEIADLLRKHGGKHGTIHSAVGCGDVEAVKEFLVAGADVNAQDEYGLTALDYAATKELADLLRRHGGKTGEELKAEGK